MSKFDIEQWRGHSPRMMGVRSTYAVLVPVIYEPGKEPSMLFEVRASTLRHQPGEVCFPGGNTKTDFYFFSLTDEQIEFLLENRLKFT